MNGTEIRSETFKPAQSLRKYSPTSSVVQAQASSTRRSWAITPPIALPLRAYAIDGCDETPLKIT